MELRKIVGENVLQWRTENNVTQKELAEKAGIDVTYLRRIEHGKANLTANVIDLLKDTMQVPMEQLTQRKKR